MATAERIDSDWTLRALDQVGKNIKCKKEQFTDMETITYDIRCYSLKVSLEDSANTLLK